MTENSTSPKYDVAISFLARDEPIASALYQKLAQGLEVFFYPRNQEELAGTDGLDSMRKPFFDDSRVVVILYREPWGHTAWTRIEQTAITDRLLHKGWSFLLFITLDDASELPAWLPHTYVRFNYQEFGMEQAVGAIKRRVQESGGVIAPVTALTLARLARQEAQFLDEKRRMLSSSIGIEGVRKEVDFLFSEIQRLCQEIKKDGFNIMCGGNLTYGNAIMFWTMTNDDISVVVNWRQMYTNSITVDSGLKVVEFKGRMELPGEQLWYLDQKPLKRRKRVYLPDLSRSGEYCWVDPKNTTEQLTSAALADRCVSRFVELAQDANKAKAKPSPRSRR